MADARGSMRSRVESAEPTSQMEQDEQEVYIKAFEERVNPPHNDTDEEAHRFAWAAVLRFREDARQSQESFASTRPSGPDILGVRPGTGGASRADRVVLDTPGSGNRRLGAAPASRASLVAAARRRGVERKTKIYI